MASDSDEWKVCETYLSISTAFAGNYPARQRNTTCDVEVQVGLVGCWYTLLSLVHCVVSELEYLTDDVSQDEMFVTICIRRGKVWIPHLDDTNLSNSIVHLNNWCSIVKSVGGM